MSTSRGGEAPCLTCGRTASVFTCAGCSRAFCLDHTNKHRQVLEQQMDEVITSHNRLVDDCVEENSEQQRSVITKQVDHWEEQSVARIRQTADRIREQLLHLTREYNDVIRDNLASLTVQLTRARDNGNFFEKDLEQWTSTLQKVQSLVYEQQNRKLYQIDGEKAFIAEVSLTKDTSDAIRQLGVTRHPRHREYYPSFDGDDEYSFGNHQVRFSLAQYQANSPVRIGVISTRSAQSADPYNNPTFHGWGKYNRVYLHGVVSLNHNNYQTDLRKDDVLQLIIDCDRHIIRLENERTRKVYKIHVDVTECPFPWRPHIHLGTF